MRYQNPIIPGFNPDPSICVTEDGYYLVTSTFEFFPGVPVYYSKNLINWELRGHALTSASQLPLEHCRISGGIYAPTIRHHNGRFYMTTTNVTSLGNFIVHTDDIGGEWSDPALVDQGGIDPSLLFDGDKVYFCSNAGEKGSAEDGIYLSEINPDTGELLTRPRCICHGTGGRFAEAPHLYHIGDYYYLMLAEGGTEYGHMETIFRSVSPWGPYESCPHNPILSHRNHGHSPIQATGHADLFQDLQGNWWLVFLAIRPLGGNFLHNLGRETFLAPVEWVDGWPVVNGGEAISLEMEVDRDLGKIDPISRDFHANFESGKIAPEFCYLRNPHTENYHVSEDGKLMLQGTELGLSDPLCSPTWLGVRQQATNCAGRAVLSGVLEDGGKAGLCAFYCDAYHYEIYLKRQGDCYFVGLNKRVHDLEAEVFCCEIEYTGEITFCLETGSEFYRFGYESAGKYTFAGAGMTAGLCTEQTAMMTFTGTFIGLFAQNSKAEFASFDLVL